MNFDLTEEQKMVKDTAWKFADAEIMPYARENDVKEHFPIEIFKKMASLGFLGGPIPEKYGGAGLDFIGDAIIFEEIGRADSSLRTALSVQVSLVGLTILNWGTEEQKQKYLPKLCSGEFIGCFALTEPNAGSDASSIITSAMLKGNEWILNGTKTWISSGSIADIAIIFAVTDKTKGHHGITAFIVEKASSGFSTKDIKGKLGLRASNTAELIFEDCKIPKDAVLSGIGNGFTVAMSALDNGRYGVASGCVGIMQGCIDACTKYAKERHQFGKPIASFQLIQEKIARMIVDCDAARLLVYRAGHLKNKGIKNTIETSIAKYFASEAANRAASDAVQIFGGYGYSNEYPVERYFRDAKVATIYEGTSEIQKLIIGGHALGIKAFS
ncbi:MAG: acyl-CoA dehydrogenase [Deltaproteobacteria bacterium GWC2_42_51]|nr:MAG: acyl-CoA dehydrogenase [Deltaproteobacteria bacterium GWA2_42_85]OGP23900.1 MAG: acyl-CoA dehydrogenase [Deltaproteobacteria bacterium GWB2_42_7]OGP36211.1 MAG: acyl-CoA dehydrogenase [Deltaproteobacteria bacterium GWC2_42_51]OGP39039.1 MAG: acyl-CoA dehydrogenase [Deltaproteobacteria bacterium GWD2_42_10]OGP47829.1 MAG: acyl-CoA dehydrogenase [Deltaproteobacteria bacterium GWF2_42_12]OGQ28284.1 MAG: acyl-CoA dehydrogenase [Deltaproteobacteria bacterium RIFCSPHIGHO2_02_FULL_42_44]OGQ3